MTYNPKIHNRQSIRLKGYDYSQAGLYFITFVCQNRKHLFGVIQEGKMRLNGAGEMVKNEWIALFDRFQNTRMHEYVVMPNHFHGILEITEEDTVGVTLMVRKEELKKTGNGVTDKRQPQGIASTNKSQGIKGLLQGTAQTKKTLGDMVGAFQSITTVEYIRGVKNKNWQGFNKRVWQRNYYEHIIRNDKAYDNISNYIINNPVKWDEDKFAA